MHGSRVEILPFLPYHFFPPPCSSVSRLTCAGAVVCSAILALGKEMLSLGNPIVLTNIGMSTTGMKEAGRNSFSCYYHRKLRTVQSWR